MDNKAKINNKNINFIPVILELIGMSSGDGSNKYAFVVKLLKSWNFSNLEV